MISELETEKSLIPNLSYFEKQFEKPYESTKEMFSFIMENIWEVYGDLKSQKVLDVGSGMGETLYFFAKKAPKWEFHGLDINRNLILLGSKYFESKKIDNVYLSQGNIYDLDSLYGEGSFDGVMSLQTLSWLDDADTAIKRIVDIKPKWIAFSSLFYDGPVEARIEITELNENGDGVSFKSPYNVYSIPRINRFLQKLGYCARWKRFRINLDLSKPVHSGMGTYTERLVDGSRIQISGPLLMNWYFCFASLDK
jgi:SAM-dependent methyltransferase